MSREPEPAASRPRIAPWVATTCLALLAIPVALLAQLGPEVPAGIVGVALTAVLAWRVFRAPEHGVYALVALMPLTDLGVVWPGTSVRITYVVLAASVAGAVWARGREAAPPVRLHPLVWLLALPFVSGLLTAPWSLDPTRSALYSARLAALWAAAAFFASQVRTRDHVRRVLGTLTAVGVALSTVALLQLVMPDAGIGRIYTPVIGDTLGRIRPAALFMDPNFLGGMLSVCVLAAAALASASKDRWDALVWSMGAAACGLGLALTISRSTWVGLGVGSVVLVALAPRGRRLVLSCGLLAVAVAAAIAVPGTTSRFTGAAPGASGDGSVNTRLSLLKGEFQIALDHPVAGTGLAALGRAYAEAGGAEKTGRVINPHQLPLAVIAETGAFGGAAMAAVLVGLAAAAVARRRRGWAVEDTVVAAALVGLLVQSVFQYYAYFEPLWLMLALAAAAPLRDDGPDEVTSPPASGFSGTNRNRPAGPAAGGSGPDTGEVT